GAPGLRGRPRRARVCLRPAQRRPLGPPRSHPLAALWPAPRLGGRPALPPEPESSRSMPLRRPEPPADRRAPLRGSRRLVAGAAGQRSFSLPAPPGAGVAARSPRDVRPSRRRGRARRAALADPPLVAAPPGDAKRRHRAALAAGAERVRLHLGDLL